MKLTPGTITGAAADGLAAEASGLDQAGTLLDAAALSGLLHREVTITHVRSKPGHSLVAAHTDLHGAAGWTMLTGDPVKYHNAAQRAADFGKELQVHQASGSHFFSGTVWTDPQLAKELAEARAVLGEETPWRVLRYNPRRRVVAAVQTGSSQKVLRVVAHGAAGLLNTARRWRSQGLPVTNVSPLGRRGSATIAALWGVSDLGRAPHPPAAETAGAAIAKLHAGPARQPDHGRRNPDPHRAAKGLVDVAPWLEGRASRLAAELEDRLAALPHRAAAQIHGDLSPDQVVLGDYQSHKIRLIDLDRAGWGSPMRDVGSWIAACRRDEQLQLIDPFLTGYTAHSHVKPHDLDVWEATAHLAGAADFFRHREPDWPARTIRALDLTEEALNR